MVIECNLRASRSFPFVSKVLKINMIDIATRVMLGLPVEKPNKNLFDLDYVGIKASQFSFNRLQKADPVLGVDMSSTGEVGCLGDNTSTALLKSMLAVGHRIPKKNILLCFPQVALSRRLRCSMQPVCWWIMATAYTPQVVHQSTSPIMVWPTRWCTGRRMPTCSRRLWICCISTRSTWL